MTTKTFASLTVSALTLFALSSGAVAAASAVSDEKIAAQRETLATSTAGAGFGPQSPRDIGVMKGTNRRSFETAPAFSKMNLCDIHFHKNAEHRGGQFTRYAGNGDGQGTDTGFKYSGELSAAELAPLERPIGAGKHGDLKPGDTIETHFVFSTAQAKPGPTLGTCLSKSIMNPQLRVEAHVFVLVNDESALDFVELSKIDVVNGLHQAPNVPTVTGTPVTYAGSTTGPSFNEKGSPLQVTWNVHPNVARVNIHSVGKWLENNVFNETHAHGVRNLVQNPDLLSEIER